MISKMNLLDKYGTLNYRPCFLNKKRNKDYRNVIHQIRKDHLFEDLTVRQIESVIVNYYKEIYNEIVEKGNTYYFRQLGYLQIQFFKRNKPSKLKPYYKELHVEFLDKRVNFRFKRISTNKHVNTINIFPSRKLLSNMISNVINRNFENIYVYN